MKKDFPMVPLGELLVHSEEQAEIDPGEFYQQVTVRLWGKGVALRAKVAGTDLVTSKQFVVRANQFILSKIDARNGAFGLIPDSLDGAIVSSDFPVFIPDRLRILPEFLDWMSKTHDFVDLCKAASEGTTNRVRLKIDRFLTTEIPLPLLEEQRRIVARIEEIATKIEEARGLRQEAEAEADVLIKAAMREIFCGINYYQNTTIDAVCAAIIDNLHSNPIYADDGVPCIRSSDVSWGRLHLDTALTTSEDEYSRRTVRGEPRVDDIILVREGGGTGKAAIVEEGQRFSLGQRVMMLRLNQDLVSPKFFLYQLLSPAIYEELIVPRCKGSASPHLNISALRTFTFLLPSLVEQRHIIDYLDSLQSKVDTLKRVQAEISAELDALLPSILDKAFKGEL